MKLDLSNSRVQAAKSGLARLLAAEGLKIKWSRGISTAAFDTKTRAIHMPIWTNASQELVDMLCIHETGHALHTKIDPEALVKRINAKTKDAIKTIHTVWNVLEDIRINELQKIKYPGSRHDFLVGYKERYDRNDYGGNIDFINKQSFLDRLNVHFKVPGVIVNFNPEEEALVKRIGKICMESEVESMIYEVLDLLRKQQQSSLLSANDGDQGEGDEKSEMKIGILTNEKPKKGEKKEENSDSDDDFDALIDMRDEESDEEDSADESGDDDGDGDNGSDGSDETGDKDSGKSKDGKSDKDGEKKSGKGDSKDGDDSKDGETDKDGSGSSDKEGETKKESKSESKGDGKGSGLGKPLPVIKFITVDAENESVSNYIKKNFENAMPDDYEDRKINITDIEKTLNLNAYREFKEESRMFINAMVSEFEMKKNANAFARMTESKTGILNMNKIYAYRISEDVFKRSSQVPDGKNHGFVFLLDTSSSMQDYMRDTQKQLVIFALFARRIGVPFEIYSFGGWNGATIFRLVTSDMNNVEFDQRCATMLDARAHGVHASGGTPLNGALVNMVSICEKFLARKKVDIFNMVTLTDGGAGDATIGSSGFFDNKTGKTIMPGKNKVKNSTDACLHLIKNRLECFYPETSISILNFNIQPQTVLLGYNDLNGYSEKFFIHPQDMRKNEMDISASNKGAELAYKTAISNTAKYMKFLKNFASRVAQTA